MQNTNVGPSVETLNLRHALAIAELEKLALQMQLDHIRAVGPAVAAAKPLQEVLHQVPLPVELPVQASTWQPITKQEMLALLTRIGRPEAALLKLWSYQLPSEQHRGGHWEKNGRGFSKMHIGDARTMVRWIQSGRTRVGNTQYRFKLLTNSHGKAWALEAKHMVMSYARQLTEIANEERSLAFLRVS